MPKWQDFLLARGRYHKFRLDFAKKSKIDWGAKMLCHFFLFQFLGSAGPKNGRIPKNSMAKFFYYYCVSMRPKLKKSCLYNNAYISHFSFSYKTPYMGQKGPPCPTGGVRGGNLTTDWFLIHRAFI